MEQADTVAPHLGDEMHELCTRAVPDLSQHHRRRRPRDARDPRRAHPARRPRGAVGHARSSTGRCPRSGTSATPTSTSPAASASSTSATHNLHVVGYSAPVRRDGCRSSSCGAPPHAARPARRRSRTAPPTTTTTGASAWRTTTTLDAARRRVRGRRIDSTLEPRLADVRRVRPARAQRTTRCSSRATCAIRRWPTTTSRVSRSRRCWPGAPASAPLALLVPLPVRPRHDRRRSPGWPATRTRLGRIDHGLVAHLRGRPRRPHLQAQPPGRRHDRPRRRARAAARAGAPHRSSTSRRTATTSASSARRASTSRSGCLTRTPHGEYPEYHTSADNLDVRAARAARRRRSPPCIEIVDVLEATTRYLNLSPKGEPQLGRRGLYRAIGGVDGPARRRDVVALGAQPVGRPARPLVHRRARRAALRQAVRRRPTASSSTTCSRPLPARRDGTPGRGRCRTWSCSRARCTRTTGASSCARWNSSSCGTSASTPRRSRRRAGSRSRHGVLHGLHGRTTLAERASSCATRGAVFEVVLDLRPWSSTYLRWTP